MEDERPFGEDESGDQGLAGLGPAHCFPHLNGERVERYSRKVFVGGLPPDIDEGDDSSLFPSNHCRGLGGCKLYSGQQFCIILSSIEFGYIAYQTFLVASVSITG